MNTKLKLISGLLIAGLTSSASASLITEWSYSNQAGFEDNYTETNSTPLITSDNVLATGNSATGNAGDALTVNTGNILNTDGNSANGVAGDNALYTQLAWGTPARGVGSLDPRSSLGIDSPVVDTMMTNNFGWAQGTAITHNNFQITGDSLLTASVLDGLALTPTNWVDKGVDSGKDALLTNNSPYFAPQLEFGVNFFETSNGLTVDGLCPNGEPNFVGDNIAGCGDIFEITGLENLPFSPVLGADFIEFTVPFILLDVNGDPLAGWNDVEYFVSTRLSGLTTLPAGYTCSNGQANCFGFVTVENSVNVLNAEFKISTVPEPTTLAIFGLGLLVTGLSGRRKRKA
tara:strand:+ start:1098 stop:2132 length:1035 start_codon:yes stop_codon:yes gene_type:complete